MDSLAQTPLTSRVIKTEKIKWKDLCFIQQENFKEWIDNGDKKLLNSLLKYCFIDPYKVWFDGEKMWCLDGYHRYCDLLEVEKSGLMVPELLDATFIDCTDIKEAAELVLVYSSIYAKISQQGLFDFIGKFDIDFEAIKETIEIPEFNIIDFEGLLNENGISQRDFAATSLVERFIIPPFSIFDSRQGYWQDRKKKWHALGFDSQETREDVELISKSGQSSGIYELRNKMRQALGREAEWDEILAEAKKRGMHVYEGASIFDPVLAEIAYTWFCPTGGTILDPFAGGSVRGIVAGTLGYNYHGIDLRLDQVEANIKQAITTLPDCLNMPQWYTGDSLLMDSLLPEDTTVDFVFSCPPYHDLEKYSDDPADLSNMDYSSFIKTYEEIIGKAIAKLKQNRFACFVIGEIRGKDGFCKGFVPDTIKCFENHGAKLYNEIILINVAGSLPIRVGRQFESGRKVGKMHQNVLVFFKGDPKKIKDDFPIINEADSLDSTEQEPNIALSESDN